MRLARAKPGDLVQVDDGLGNWLAEIVETERMALIVQPLDGALKNAVGARRRVGKRDVTQWYQKR